jgi:hypothetical protein
MTLSNMPAWIRPGVSGFQVDRHNNTIVILKCISDDSSVGITLGYGAGDRGSRFRFLADAGNFSLHHRVQNGSGYHRASCPMGTRGFFPGGVKRSVREADHLPPSSAEVKE